MNNIIQNAIETSVPNVSINPKTHIDDILILPPVHCQRDHVRRVKKMNEHFIKPFNSMHNFSVFNVTKEFTIQLHGEDILVDRGLYLADGSTRAESKRQLDSGQNHIGYDPEHTVVTTIYDIDNPKSYMGEYYSMDSSEAVENGADKIRGSIRLLEMSLTSKKGLSGQWGTALNASYPGETDTDRYLKMGYFKYQILMLDEHSMWNTTEK